MAPARSSTRRAAHPPSVSHDPGHGLQNEGQNASKQIFREPSFGTPLEIYIEKEVEDKDFICQLIQDHGGTVSQRYSRVSYILVDPHKTSGQNLYRQYAGKEGKVVLDARWVHECIKAGALRTYQTDWGGCRVAGTETVYTQQQRQTSDPSPVDRPLAPMNTQTLPPAIPSVEQIQAYPFPMYPPPIHAQPAPRHLNTTAAAGWPMIDPSQPITPAASTSQQHIIHRPPHQPPDPTFREGTWDYNNAEDISAQPSTYDYPRYRDDQNGWVPPGPYYDAAYEPSYGHPPYLEDQPDQSSGTNSVTGQAPMSVAGPSTQPEASDPERSRGRKRTRNQPPPAVPASSLVVNRNPPARSPTPPTRVIKSTYGGNLFTADDVLYLKKYIDYCQEQCLVLSLREICERIAVKAPHHTFYSWRRYCNKHKIKLGGYTMNRERSASLAGDHSMGMSIDSDDTPTAPSIQMAESSPVHASGRLDMAAAKEATETVRNSTRSPTPPKSLFRSTTGKGVAFTQEDVNFLMKFMTYRKAQGSFDVVAFWRDVAIKAPHHSRASWMKFWRRHKHELDWEDGDDPLPPPPEKKLRYSKEDDILLAKYFYDKPDGTSDKIFQAFGRLHPHHPWKGWQEHHRIHRVKIDQLIERLANGETLDVGNVEET